MGAKQRLPLVHAEDEDEAIYPADNIASKERAGRGVLLKHLPLNEEVIASDIICSCTVEHHFIGEDFSERLDIVPAQLRMIVTLHSK